MNNKVRSALVLVAMLSWTLGAQAGMVTSFGQSDWGEGISRPNETRKAWLLGYLSGMNEVHVGLDQDPQNPLGMLSSADQAFLWMDSYCRTNPLEKVA